MSTADVTKTLDFALRVGEVLMSSGAGAADVSATMNSIAHHAGYPQSTIDVTFNSLHVSHSPVDEMPVTLLRHVTHREIDYDDLTQVDHLIAALLTDEIDLDEARTQLNRISSTGHARPRWAITFSWALMGGGIAMLLGGGVFVTATAAFAAGVLEVLQRKLTRFRLPLFYTQIAGGLTVTLIAMLLDMVDIKVNPSLVVTTGIVTMLAGLGFIGAIQDALTGFYITAGARILEVIMATVGIIVGVSGGLTISHALGVEMRLDPSMSQWAHMPWMIGGAALSGAAFAYSSYAPARTVAPIAALSGLGGGVFLLMTMQGFGRAWPAGVCAVIIGFLAYFIAGWCRVPPLVIVVSCIVPLLPGLSIYRALTLLANENLVGVLSMITAAAVAVALSAGVIFGEYLAQPLRREARRLEQRLAGPRLVGPLRARTLRKQKRAEREQAERDEGRRRWLRRPGPPTSSA